MSRSATEVVFFITSGDVQKEHRILPRECEVMPLLAIILVTLDVCYDRVSDTAPVSNMALAGEAPDTNQESHSSWQVIAFHTKMPYISCANQKVPGVSRCKPASLV